MSFIEMEQTISCQQTEIEDLKAANAALKVAKDALERLSPSLNKQHPTVIFVFEALAKINEVMNHA